jgi:hypothetical protein
MYPYYFYSTYMLIIRAHGPLRSAPVNAHLGVLPDWLVELKSRQSLNLQPCDACQQLPEQTGELRSLQDLGIISCQKR